MTTPLTTHRPDDASATTTPPLPDADRTADADSTAGADATATADGADATDATATADDVSWVERCQRQFADADRRLPNLVDDENHVMYGGV